MMKMDFKGKTAVVTGGSRGIGEAIARYLLELNCRVIVTSTKIIPSWCSNYSQCDYKRVDFLSTKSVQNFLKAVNSEKNIDILINNAGIHIPEVIYKIKESNWDKILKVNLYGPMRTMRIIALKMKAARSGKILNVSSIAGIVSKPGSNAYSASKAALLGLTRASALDLAPYNILVNAICPGHTQTEMIDNMLTKEQRGKLRNSVPLKRFADPSEIAKVAVFLCSDLNTYITGQAIVIDGGVSIQ